MAVVTDIVVYVYCTYTRKYVLEASAANIVSFFYFLCARTAGPLLWQRPLHCRLHAPLCVRRGGPTNFPGKKEGVCTVPGFAPRKHCLLVREGASYKIDNDKLLKIKQELQSKY